MVAVRMWRHLHIGRVAALLLSALPRLAAQQPPGRDYLVYVVCESADRIVRVRFGPHGARVEGATRVGLMPADVNGPHGIVISPDRQFVYVSVAHGRPYGSVWKFRAATDAPLGFTPLGLFPATMDITRSGEFLFVVNANFHGDMVPSSVSVVSTAELAEVKRIPTCIMPHGSRLNSLGTRHYSVCMMDDMLVEIDAGAFAVTRHFILTPGHERGVAGAPAGHAMTATSSPTLSCVPTWAQPSNDGSLIYVACNKSNDIAVVDAKDWKLLTRIPAGGGVYNLAIAPDGRLIATNKRGQSVSIFDPASGRELARLPTKRKVVHGAVVSPDNRYAFVTVEGIGTEPGTLEVIDLAALQTVARLDLPSQAAGIDFWRMEGSPQ
jgi:DNA-binding beta-propeller fold protein YncE